MKIKILIMFAVIFFFQPIFDHVSAATLKFDPVSAHKEIGESFELKVIVDTAGKRIYGVDAHVSYDPAVLEVVGINDATFLKVVHKEFATPGRLYIGAVVEDPASDKEGIDTIASIVFKTKANGYSDVKYICELGETNESNIPESTIDANDIIECAQNGKSTISVGTGVAPTSTDSASPDGSGDSSPDGSDGSSGGSDVSTPSPTGLLRGGIMDNFFGFILVGAVLLLAGWGIRYIIL